MNRMVNWTAAMMDHIGRRSPLPQKNINQGDFVMKTSFRRYFVILTLLGAALLPAVSDAAVFCTRTITGVRVSDAGRLQIRAKDTATNSDNILLTLCNLEYKLGTVEPETCAVLYSQLLAAFHTGSDISIQFRDATLSSQGLWGGTCDSLLHHGDFSSAFATIETK